MKLIDYNSVGEHLWHEVLDNGLNIFVIPKPAYNKSYAFFATKYGGCDRRFKLSGEWIDTPAGVAHFLEHKMFDTETGNALTELSANGASPNAFTSDGITAYHFECTDNFFENLRILLNFVTVPFFTDESVAKEQGIIGQEIKMSEDNPSRTVYQNLMKALYKNHPIRDSIAGTVESIARINAQMLYDCHKVFYNPSNMVLCVAGDVEPQAVIDITREIVCSPAGELPERDYGKPETAFPDKKSIDANMEISAPLFIFGSKLLGNTYGDSFLMQSLLCDFACEILTGRSSPLYAKLYREGIINRNFYSGVSTFPGGMAICVGGESREPDRIYDEVCAEAVRLVSAGIDEKLFSQLKKAAIGGFISSLDSISSICYSLAEGHFKGYSPYKSLEVLQSISQNEVTALLGTAFDSEKTAMSLIRPISAGN